MQACLVAVLFVSAASITVLAIHKWKRIERKAISSRQESADNIPGVAEGELVQLPKLPSLENDSVDLSTVEQKYLLCGFVSTECAGCAQDQRFWKDLSKGISEESVAFYVISLDVDQSRVESFAKAYEFGDLPVLFDPKRQALTAFRIQFVPQYVLLTPRGRIIARWNGVRRYDPKREYATDKLPGLLEHLSAPVVSLH